MVIIASLINQAGNMGFVFLVLYVHEYLKFSLMQGTLAFATFSGCMLLSGIIAGPFIDKISAVKVMLCSLLLNSLFLLTISMEKNYHMLLLSCAGWGFSFGMYRPALQTLINYFSKTGSHKLTFSIHRLASNLGMSIGPLIGGYIAIYSFKLLFVVNGLANLIALLILYIGLTGSKWMTYKFEEKINFNFFAEIKLNKNILMFLSGIFLVGAIFFQHESTLGVFLIQDLHFSSNVYGLLFTINTLMIVTFELLLNIATINWSYRINFMLGALLIGLGMCGFYTVTTVGQVMFLCVLWTLGEMIIFPAASSYIADLAPENKRGSYMSFFNTGLNLGMLVGPWIGSVVMEHISAQALWISCGMGGLLAVAIFNFVKEPLPID